MNQKKTDTLSREISNNLLLSSRSYYTIGIKAFHQSKVGAWSDFQPAIGNLSISIELLLKSIIARKTLALLYVGLPPEISIFLCYPESITPDQNINKYINSLKHFEKSSIELNHAKDLFLKLFPELKLEFGSFLNNLSYIRNSSVHSSVPDFKRYELNSIAYHSTKLFLKLDSLNQLGYMRVNLDARTTEFLYSYKEDKIKKVKKAMSDATIYVSSGKFAPDNSFNIRDWQSMPIECPICGCFATLFGQSEYQCNMNEDEILVFNSESLHCASCKLKLEDYEELILANIEASQDRDHDMDDWKNENGDFDEDGNFYPYR